MDSPDTPILIEMLSTSWSQQAASLILPIQQLEFNVPITLDDQPDLLDIDRFYIHPGGGFWGAIKDNELIGTIALIDVGHATGVIRKMFVKKEFRGKALSIAQQLIATLLDHARSRGLSDLYLGTVDKMKAAHRFYERNGFYEIGIDHLPGYFPRMPSDNIFYHLSTRP